MKKRGVGRPKGSTTVKVAKAKGKRGRKAIFTPAQKTSLDKMIRASLKNELRAIARAL